MAGGPGVLVSGFNPRAREGRDAARLSGLRTTPVSIHAPVKGATVQTARSAVAMSVSIHAPVKGATARRRSCRSYTRGFNPRAREGRDALAVRSIAR